MKRYLITEDGPSDRYKCGDILLVWESSEIDCHAREVLQDRIIDLNYEEKERWNRPFGYIGVDPGAERRKWAKYHKAKKAAKASSGILKQQKLW